MTSKEVNHSSQSFPKGKNNYTLEQRQQKQKERNQRIRAKKKQESQAKGYIPPTLTKWTKVEARRALPAFGIEELEKKAQAKRQARNVRRKPRQGVLALKAAPPVPSWRFFSRHHTSSINETYSEQNIERMAAGVAQRKLPWRQRQAMKNVQCFTNRVKNTYKDMPKRYLKGEDGKLHRVDVPAGKAARNE